MIKIVIADDHELILDGYSTILEPVEDVAVVGLANNGREVLTILETVECDLVLLDINMPKMDGLETARIIKRGKPHIRILILTMLNNIAYIKELVELGVEGYVLKNCGKQILLEAINHIAAGRTFFDSTVSQVIDQGYKGTYEVEGNAVLLSEREIEIVRMIALGLTTKQVAEELFISPHTVQTHRKNINFKLNVHNPAELTSFAKDNGILPVK
ncbi:MAG: response regulator transcription factor [Bacteroidia bacterium]|nr:response regulator transcription factor [Bacteroidia bacterium]